MECRLALATSLCVTIESRSWQAAPTKADEARRITRKRNWVLILLARHFRVTRADSLRALEFIVFGGGHSPRSLWLQVDMPTSSASRQCPRGIHLERCPLLKFRKHAGECVFRVH